MAILTQHITELNPHLSERWGKSPRPTNRHPQPPAQTAIDVNPALREYLSASQKSVSTSSWLSCREVPTSAEILGIDEEEASAQIGTVGSPDYSDHGKGKGKRNEKAEAKAREDDDDDDDNDDNDTEYNDESRYKDLPSNVINGPYHSKEEYLSVHYELLREDAVAPLRDAVERVKADPTMLDNKDTCIYENVHICGFTFSNTGPAARITMSMARAGKKILWAQSKRLVPGTLVALTPAKDIFQNICKVATVAARPLAVLERNPAEIDIFFASPEEIEIDPHVEWVMVEARAGFFESYRHTLVGLQKLMTERFPLSDHLIHLEKAIDAPAYVRSNSFIDLSTIFPTVDNEGGMENVDILHGWPDSPPTSLDRSQLSALRRILTKKLAVVQGPPGTGKTHVSVVALKALLRNMTVEDPPIIITSQTNHALDQLLRHVAEFESQFVRLGGRTLDQDIIKKRTIHEVRKSLPTPKLNGGMRGPAHAKLQSLTKRMIDLLNPLLYQEEPLEVNLLCGLGLLSESQKESLENGASQWVRHGLDHRSDNPMAVWLGDSLVFFDPKYKAVDLGVEFEEVDLEYEQLKELEAETSGVIRDDEDMETLKGKYIFLADRFTARESLGLTKKRVDKALETQDLWKVPESLRGAVYNSLQQRLKKIIQSKYQELSKDYMKAVQELKFGRWEMDFILLSKAKIVGMTTTGLGKYRGLIASLKPRIIVVEEAAETLEGPIMVACMESLEHLVMVGDHQQLRGQCSVGDLASYPYYLDVSMFERLVSNDIPYTTLTRQRRMIPEIRRLLAPIYKKLDDHPSVLERAPVPGMGGINSFFFTHTWNETKDVQRSSCNQKEADMVVNFFDYLVLNGMDVKDITVLTFYNGQRKLILRLLKNHPNMQGKYFKVVTVDSYQGEENGIVLLSLVRSNDHGDIGFLDVHNRVCVALSRAQRGFYLFGNAELLCHTEKLWWKVVKLMAKPRRIGWTLALTCDKHGRKSWIGDPIDWVNHDGGCDLDCGGMLPCAHRCSFKCHPFPCELVKCNYPCERQLDCGHACVEDCFKPCRCLCGEGSGPILQGTDAAVILAPSDPSPERSPNRSELSEAYHTLVDEIEDHDARLEIAAIDEIVRLQRLKIDQQLQHSAIGGLDGSSSPKESAITPKATKIRTISNGNGGIRTTWTEVYRTAAQTRKEEPEEISLLDLDLD